METSYLLSFSHIEWRGKEKLNVYKLVKTTRRKIPSYVTSWITIPEIKPQEIIEVALIENSPGATKKPLLHKGNYHFRELTKYEREQYLTK